MQLDRVVVLARDHVGLIDLHLGARERSVGIAAPRFGWRSRALVLLRRRNRLDAGYVRGCGFSRVGGAPKWLLGRLLQGFGDHERNRLTLMVHAIVLEHMQAFADGGIGGAMVLAIGEPRRVLVRKHGEDAWRAFAAVPSMEASWPPTGASTYAARRMGIIIHGSSTKRGADLKNGWKASSCSRACP